MPELDMCQIVSLNKTGDTFTFPLVSTLSSKKTLFTTEFREFSNDSRTVTTVSIK